MRNAERLKNVHAWLRNQFHHNRGLTRMNRRSWTAGVRGLQNPADMRPFEVD